MQSFRISFRGARLFTEYLASLPAPPQQMSDLTPEHVDGYHVSRCHASHAPMELGVLKASVVRR